MLFVLCLERMEEGDRAKFVIYTPIITSVYTCKICTHTYFEYGKYQEHVFRHIKYEEIQKKQKEKFEKKREQTMTANQRQKRRRSLMDYF